MQNWLLLLVLAFAPTSAGSEADFDRALASAQKLAQSGRWSHAGRELDRLFENHAEAGYLLPRLTELVDLYQRCQFFSDYKAGKLEDSLEGRLTAWNPSTGTISLTYTEINSDFSSDGAGARIHPVEFIGPYRVEVRGHMGATPTSATEIPSLPQLLVVVNGSESHQVSFGVPEFKVDDRMLWIPPRISFNGRGEPTVLAQGSSTDLAFDREYRIAVEVEKDKLTAYLDDRVVMQAAKAPNLFGHFGLLDLPGLTHLELSGTVNSAWLDSRKDTSREEAWRRFRSRWDSAEELPAWVSKHLESSAEPAYQSKTQFQAPVTKSQLDLITQLSELMNSGQYEEGLQRLDALNPGDLAPEIEHYFGALYQFALGRSFLARDRAKAALHINPGFNEAKVMLARALAELGDDHALEILSELVGAEPGFTSGWVQYASACLEFGQADRAQEVIVSALRAGVPAQLLRSTESLLTRALSGPVWEQTFEYQSRHYTVRSDIDRQTCFDAAQVLETALRFYQFRLGRLSSKSRMASTYPVYVFSGRAGYDSYAGDLFGRAPESTAGLYSPGLKQLLVWNPAEKDRLAVTLRHEGLHQFLDASLGRLPAWFNEGMAEYFESAELVRGVQTVGQSHELHTAMLLSPGHQWIPFEELLNMPEAEFYEDATAKYAQSWALVHWLQNSGRTNEQFFARLFAELSRGGRTEAITVELLALGELEQLVRAHLKSIER